MAQKYIFNFTKLSNNYLQGYEQCFTEVKLKLKPIFLIATPYTYVLYVHRSLHQYINILQLYF